MSAGAQASPMTYDFTLFYPSFFGVNFGPGWMRSAAECPPLGPLCLATPLLSAGYRVRFCDLNVEHLTVAEFDRLVRDTGIFGISLLTAQVSSALQLVTSIRSIRQDAIIIAGGHHCHLLDKPFPGCEVTVTTEAERQIVDLLRALQNGGSLEAIPGLLYEDKGRVVRTPALPVDKDLDTLPRPARSLVQPGNYGYLFGAQLSRRVTSMATTRGCPHHCAFCIRAPYPRYRERSVDDVVEEMAELQAQGYDTVIMADEHFMANRKRVLAIMDELKRRRVRLRLIFQTRVDSVDEKICPRLKAGGTFAILFGIESACQDILDYYNKGATVEEARTAIVAADRAGIFTYAGFVVGAAMETEAHLQQNIAFVTSVPLDFVSFHQLVYMYGTPLWRWAREAGILADDEPWVPSDERFGGPSAAQIDEWRRVAFKRFYLRPRQALHLIYKCLRARSLLPFRLVLQLLAQVIRDPAQVSWVHRTG